MALEEFMVNGRILMLALDHRGSIDKMLPAGIPAQKHKETIIEIKRLLITALAPLYSGVLFDAEYGIHAYDLAKANPDVRAKPYLMCIEKTGYTDTDHERLTVLEYSVAELKAMGAKGVKILLFFHPDARTAQAQIDLTQKVYEDCKQNNVPFFLELLNYSLDGTPYDTSVLVPRSVKMFLNQGIRADVFKLEFPGTADACREVTAMLEKTPWILLTKGASYDAFVSGLKIAIANGARGFLAGRSIWQEFARLQDTEWEHYMQTTVKARFAEIRSIALS